MSVPDSKPKLFQDNPHCCYCGKKLQLYGGEEFQHVKALPPDFATIEHKFPNTTIMGHMTFYKHPCNGTRGFQITLACPKCNHKMGKQGERKLVEWAEKHNIDQGHAMAILVWYGFLFSLFFKWGIFEWVVDKTECVLRSSIDKPEHPE